MRFLTLFDILLVFFDPRLKKTFFLPIVYAYTFRVRKKNFHLATRISRIKYMVVMSNELTIKKTLCRFFTFIFYFNNRPHKTIWHGSSTTGERAMDMNCNAWSTATGDTIGLASSLLSNKVLNQERHSCENQFIVLCIEALSHQSSRRKRHLHRFENILLIKIMNTMNRHEGQWLYYVFNLPADAHNRNRETCAYTPSVITIYFIIIYCI